MTFSSSLYALAVPLAVLRCFNLTWLLVFWFDVRLCYSVGRAHRGDLKALPDMLSHSRANPEFNSGHRLRIKTGCKGHGPP